LRLVLRLHGTPTMVMMIRKTEIIDMVTLLIVAGTIAAT
jgi:hypothetical protein